MNSKIKRLVVKHQKATETIDNVLEQLNKSLSSLEDFAFCQTSPNGTIEAVFEIDDADGIVIKPLEQVLESMEKVSKKRIKTEIKKKV